MKAINRDFLKCNKKEKVKKDMSFKKCNKIKISVVQVII